MKKILLAILALILVSCERPLNVEVYYDTNSTTLSYGIGKLGEHLEMSSHSMEEEPASTAHHIVILTPSMTLRESHSQILSRHIADINTDGYKIVREDQDIYILGQTDRGCLYAIMDIIEQLGNSGDVAVLEERMVNPALSFRAIKFNLPWSPYRPGESTELHKETCRDLNFWEAFLDMMVENRFNALSLWNNHPFPYMIKSTSYPAATPFSDEELKEWRTFWKALFKMAMDRGIETFLVNWNIVVSPEFAEAYGAKEYFDRSELVKKYTKESVTQLINEYENLTGLGVTLADWMGNWGEEKMTPTEREDWIEETFVAGMKEAERKIKFIHRAVLAGDPKEMRRVIDHADLPDKTIVEVKFNWSHGHSTPRLSLTHSNDEGTIMRDFWDPLPDNYFIAWMIRNEDFFVLRWGDPEFIKEHIRTNRQEYVEGYFVGSEGYIPALDYSHKEGPHKTWDYAFEKQWLFYHLWGRLLFNPAETEEALAKAYEKRYAKVDALTLLKAQSLASRVPLHLASFYKGTWDFTLYSEGFLAAHPNGFDDNKSPFISIEELINHETLDKRYLSIGDYCHLIHSNTPIDSQMITPLMLAQTLEDNCTRALTLLDSLEGKENEPALISELADIKTWCYLGYYFADKLRAGVSLENYNLSKQLKDKENAIVHLEKCLGSWKEVVRLTADRYKPMPYVSMGHHEPKWPEFTSFHWSTFTLDVEADIEYVVKIGEEE
jgi:hypothetical protein